MALTPTQNNFTAGEVSPRLHGRGDLSAYKNGLGELTNMIVWRHGGVTRRMGSIHICAAAPARAGGRLAVFRDADGGAITLEFGDGAIRVIGDADAPFADPPVFANPDFARGLAGWTPHNAATTAGGVRLGARGRLRQAGTIDDAGRLLRITVSAADGDVAVRVGASAGAANILADQPVASGETRSFAFTPGVKTFHVQVAQTAGTPRVSFAGFAPAPYEIASPYAGETIGRLKMAQAGLRLWIVENRFRPRVLQWRSDGGFTLSAPRLTNDPFTAGDWPRAVGFFEQRLVFASTRARPQTLFFSRLAAETDFTPGPRADEAIVYTIASEDGGVIRWLSAQRRMFVGATNGVWVVDAFDAALGFAPDNISARRHTRTASADAPPRAVADGVLFIQRGGTKLRALDYRTEREGYVAREVSLMSEHLLRPGLRVIDHQEEPEEILWAVRDDGALVGFTFDAAQGVSAWHRHPLGGDAVVESLACPDGVGEDPLWLIAKRTVGGVERRWIERLAPAFTPADGSDRAGMRYLDASIFWRGADQGVWRVASAGGFGDGAQATLTRQSGGAPLTANDRGAIWRLTPRDVDGFVDVRITAIVDGDTASIVWDGDAPAGTALGAVFDGVETTAMLGGLDRFEGAVVGVVVDGATHPDRAVADGAITLQSRASLVLVGFPYESVVETLDMAARDAPPGRTRMKRIHQVDIDVIDSAGGRIGAPGAPGDAQPLRAADDPMDGPPALWSGVRRLSMPAGHDRIGRVRIVQDLPSPLTLRGLTARMEVTD